MPQYLTLISFLILGRPSKPPPPPRNPSTTVRPARPPPPETNGTVYANIGGCFFLLL